MPSLFRLPPEDRRFVELFVLAGGSIKEVGKTLGVSYPTVRNRLDKIISDLRAKIRDRKGGSSEKGGKS